MGVRNYRDLIAWRKAMDLAERVYLLTAKFPSDERFALTSQLRRAAISVPSNVAEGEGRFSKVEFRRFLSIAHGSLRELETQLILATRLGYTTEPELESALEISHEVGRIIQGLANSLKKTQ